MLNGSIVALITPFLNSKVDYHKLEELLDFHLVSKTDSLLLLGTTAESSTLSSEECREIVLYCMNYLNTRIKIIVGLCSNDTNKSIIDCKYYSNIGINYFLVITPYYNKSNENGIYEHFKQIANCTNANIILYNIPGRTNVNLSYDLVKKLSSIYNIVGIKDANENLKESIKLFSLDIDIYCGNDEYMLLFMALGAKGIINVSGNIIPKEIKKIYDLCCDDNFIEARNIFNIYKDFIISLFLETNPIGVKEAMNILSMGNDELRMPLTKMSTTNHDLLKKEILKIGKYFNC